MRPASVFLQPLRENLVSFAQQTKEANFISKKNAFSVLFFGERECIMYQIYLLAEIRADATTSTVSLIILLLSFVIYNLQ